MTALAQPEPARLAVGTDGIKGDRMNVFGQTSGLLVVAALLFAALLLISACARASLAASQKPPDSVQTTGATSQGPDFFERTVF